MRSHRWGWSAGLLLMFGTAALLSRTLAGGQTSALPDDAGLPKKAATLLGLRCLGCHNPQKKAGGLDLSTHATALAAGALGLRDIEHNRIIQMTTQGKMPPDGKLSETEITLLQRWVAAGAVYPRERLKAITPARKPLWSLQPIQHPAVPHSRFDALARNPIDSFVFAKLEHNGLRPSPPATRLALLRRVTVDLTGLPPTPEEIKAFLADRSPNAYEKVVDRLLASPAYGERWGRHWLDVVRYGESNGYEQNHLRPNAWPYRDYVIRSFNQDKPYTQFVTEQLAGDVVGKGDPDVEVATGFLVAGIHDTVGNQTEEGTRQQRANDLDDMVTTTGAALLGLTLNCARCHDHKFDPIPTRDYYRLSAVFAGVRYGERALPPRPLSGARQEMLNRLQVSLQTVSGRLAALDAQARARLTGGMPKPRPPVNPRRNVEDFAPVVVRFVRFTVLATGDGAEPCLDELQVFGPDGDRNLALDSNGATATASSLLPGYAIHQIDHLNDGLFGNEHSWISNERGGGWAQIELAKPALVNRVVWGRDANERFRDRLATAYRVEVSADGRTWRQVGSGEDRATSDEISPDKLLQAMTPEQRTERAELSAEVQALQGRVAALAPPPTAYIGQFTSPDPTFVLNRGDVMHRGDAVTPGALSQIAALSPDLDIAAASDIPAHAPRTEAQDPGAARPQNAGAHLIPAGAGARDGEKAAAAVPPEARARLALARWICDPHNPLTARVIVNRVWEHHFGRGIVGTPSDFGNLGEPPSHPELLDWLAGDLMAHGWTLKRLHRLMVTSYVYQQVSAIDPVRAAKDADNGLLWRMPLRRMEAEAVRDAVLSASGKLDRTMGGPSFQLFNYRVFNVAIYEPKEEQGPDTWRRSVYQMPARGIHDDLLGNFDCPDSSERTPRRTSTTTALQALTLLNGRFIAEQAGFYAERIHRAAGRDPHSEITQAFTIAFGRPPTLAESRFALHLVSRYGLSTLCRALLNANEFLYY